MSADNIILAIDAMSGDHGPAVVVAALKTSLASDTKLAAVLFGDEQQLSALTARLPKAQRERISLVHTDEVVTMAEPPAQALRHKTSSSMRMAVDAVAAGQAHACVSAGNTGALMAMSRHVLKMIPGVDRPAIVSPIPASKGKHTWMLDLGANLRCEPQHLYQFALMGAALAELMDGKAKPRIALLNIGSEEIKGVYEVRECAAMLRESHLNYIGFIEGNDLFSQQADVVVCDGLLGNVALKTMEGMAAMMIQLLKAEVQKNIWTQLRGLLAKPLLRRFGSSMDPRHYNGASLLGLRRVVVKSHGAADSLAFANALGIAIEQAKADLPKRIERQLQMAGNALNSGADSN